MPQDQDDTKGADAMKQAPTPGPLSRVTVSKCLCGQRGCSDYWLNGIGKFCQGSGFDKDEADLIAGLLNARLAPTAPVEASGSEREGIMAVIDRNKCEPWTVDRAGQMADEILNLRPQPSGETREAVQKLLEEAEDFTDRMTGQPWACEIIERLVEAITTSAPVASGGQHSSGEDAAWTWLNGHVECDPADRDYSADEMVDAFMAGAGRYDRWSKALERIAGEHQHRSGYCQTDITVEPALTAEEAQTVARDALSGTPTPSEAPVAETAGEAVEDLWQELCERDDRTSPEEYPEMCLINFDELSDFITRATPPVPAQDDALRIAVEALEYYAGPHALPNEGPWGASSDDYGRRATETLRVLHDSGWADVKCHRCGVAFGLHLPSCPRPSALGEAQ